MKRTKEIDEYVEQAKLGKHVIVKLDEDYYVCWSSEVDGPITYGGPRDDIVVMLDAWEHVFSQPGQAERRLAKLDRDGTTEMGEYSAAGTYEFNKCGPEGQRLSIEGLRRMWRDEEAYNNFEPREGEVIPWED